MKRLFTAAVAALGLTIAPVVVIESASTSTPAAILRVAHPVTHPDGLPLCC